MPLTGQLAVDWGMSLIAPLAPAITAERMRRPHLLETNLPGVFAVGDVHAGQHLKRVASAVGEGSIAVAFVHQALSE